MIKIFKYFLGSALFWHFPVLAMEEDDSSKENRISPQNNQVISASPTKAIRPRIMSQGRNSTVVQYLGVDALLPATYEVVDPYSGGYEEYLRKIHHDMAEKIGKSYSNKNRNEQPVAAFFHSNRYNIQLFFTNDVTHYQLYPDYFQKMVKKKDSTQLLINNFFNDLSNTLATGGNEVPKAEGCVTYLSSEKLKNLIKLNENGEHGKLTPLQCLMNLYDKHQVLFEEINEELANLEDSFIARKAEIEDKYSHSANEKNLYHKQNSEAYQASSNVAYSRLIEEKTFKSIIKKEYKNSVVAHRDIFELIIGWYDVCESFLATCVVGAWSDGEYGHKFYDTFIFPFLDSLLMNPKNYYLNLRALFEDDFGDQFKRKRFDVVKFKAEGSGQIPAIAVCGFELNPKKAIKLNDEGEKEKSNKPAPKENDNSCLVM